MSAVILVVEDDERSLRLARRLLEMDGHDVRCALTGADAMNQMQSQRPSLVVMDIQLPDANGVDLLGWMRQRPALSAVPVIAMTASVMPVDSGRVAAAGFDAIFGKPLEDVDALQHTVRALLARG